MILRARELLVKVRVMVVPPPRLRPSEWLDQNRVISRDYPSPFPGPWRTSRTPYLEEPINSFAEPGVETIVLKFSSQIGKTEALFGMMMYSYGVDPGPGMLVLPTLDLAGAVSTDRLAPALKSCAALRVGIAKSRTTDNAVLHKKINGLPLTLSGANSPASLSSRPVRSLFADEIDRWPATTPEGDPLSLVVQRTSAFRRRKKVLTSTPTIKNASCIEDQWEMSDRRLLFAPCPRCSAKFVVKWQHVRWDAGSPASAHIECPACGGRVEDRERKAMFASATWRPTYLRCSCGEAVDLVGDGDPVLWSVEAREADWVADHSGPEHQEVRNTTRGYHTWAVVSPWVRLSEIVFEFLKAKRQPDTLQAWVNLTLGETWETPGEKVESAELMLRREPYDQVPIPVPVLTMGVDTQDDRLEAMVVAWGPEEECWVVSRESLYGDPAKPDVWVELDQVLARPWPTVGAPARIQCTLVDALGHRTAAVYAAVFPRQSRRVLVSIGKDGGDAGQIVSQPKALQTPSGNVMRHIVDASQVKSLIYSRLRIQDKAGPGVIHFPMTVGDVFFTELTSEHLVTERNKYGVPAKKWALRPGHKRNETLDCFGMALAALRVICPNRQRFAELVARITASAASSKDTTPTRPKAPRTQGWNRP